MRPASDPVWRSWILPAVWIVLNFIVSSDLFSSAHTSLLLRWALNVLHVHVDNLVLLNHLVRKTGHFAGYAVLGGLMFRAWRATWPEPRRVRIAKTGSGRRVQAIVEPLWTLRWSALAIAGSALAAALDEFHQSFVPSRTGALRDVALDTVGAVFIQLILMLVWLDRTEVVEGKQ